jgi:hypothetical protein
VEAVADSLLEKKEKAKEGQGIQTVTEQDPRIKL